MVGHWGAKALWPENTMLSFEKVIGQGCVEEKTLSELRCLDIGGGEKIPLLSELLDLVNGTDLMLNVEMKDYRPEALDYTIRMLTEYGLSDQ